MADGKVLHASHDGVHVLRYIGDIRYTLTPSINRFLEGVFAGPKPAGFVIDLTQADSIDSTNLGQLARIAAVLEVTPEFLLSEAVGNPNEAVIDEAFFRKYKRLPEADKKRIRRILDAWDEE